MLGYIDSGGKPKVIEPNFAPKNKVYSHLFNKKIIEVLKQVCVQKTLANILQTTPYIVRSVMEHSVERAVEKRGLIHDFIIVSIDEKS